MTRRFSSKLPNDDSASDSDINQPSRKKFRWNSQLQQPENGLLRTDPGETLEDARNGTYADDLEQEREEDTQNKIYFAATCHSMRVAAAYYNPTTCTIHVLEDTQESTHYDLITMCLEHVAPNVILTNWRADERFIDIMRSYADNTGTAFTIRLAKDFSAAKGRDRLLSLGLFSEEPDDADTTISGSSNAEPLIEPRDAYSFMMKRKGTTRDPTLVRWNASIRLNSYASSGEATLCMASVGALLDYIVRERAVGNLEDEGIGDLNIRGIEALTLNQVMQLNSDALTSLQVFEDEAHASVYSDRTKEGLSLFGTLNFTVTTLGRSLLRTWLTRPSLSLEVINQRHEAVACFLSSENHTTSRTLHTHLNGISNVPRFLGRIKSGKAKITDWQGVVKFTYHISMVYDTLGELRHAGHVEIICKLFSVLDITHFKEIGSIINTTIDWEESTDTARVCVRPHVDEELDRMKHIYHGIDSVLSKVAQTVWETVSDLDVPSLNVVYFPQLGFLICVPMIDRWTSEAGIQAPKGWSFQFSSESHVYFKSEQMHDLDVHIGDLHSSIVDREIEIIQSLLEQVCVYQKEIADACDTCAELDCLLSFATASREYDYHRPTMVENNIIDIIGGRHALQERLVDTFVPNDVRLVGGRGTSSGDDDNMTGSDDSEDQEGKARSIVVCTGANACGKSVYLKQVALIQIMAQIGCFIPAEKAVLGITDKIFTRIQTRESVSKTQSAFMIDLNQVSYALRNCTARSLLLLDEFGKGTLVTDGAGLFCGIIKHLLDRGVNCPKVIAATHFHEVFAPGMIDPATAPVAFFHMRVMLTNVHGELLTAEDEKGDDDNDPGNTLGIHAREKLVYLYRVAEGLATESYAARCAEIFGIPRYIARRAQYVSDLLNKHEIGILLDEAMTEVERADYEDTEAICRRFLAIDLTSEAGRSQAIAGGVKRLLADVLRREVD